MRSAACTRTSSQLRIVFGAGSGTEGPRTCSTAAPCPVPVEDDSGTVGVPPRAVVTTIPPADPLGVDEQPAASSARPATPSRQHHSMQRTIDFLRQFLRDAVDAHQVGDACMTHTAHAAEA